MDIQLTEEQELLRSSIQRLLRDQYDFDERRKIVATDEGFSRKHWSAFAELGLCAAPFQESSGGLGGGALATMIVMQEFGRKLVVEPYLETVVLAGGLIEDVGSPEQRASFLPAIMDGSVGASGCDLNINSVAISAGATVSVSSFTITFPA